MEETAETVDVYDEKYVRESIEGRKLFSNDAFKRVIKLQ